MARLRLQEISILKISREIKRNHLLRSGYADVAAPGTNPIATDHIKNRERLRSA